MTFVFEFCHFVFDKPEQLSALSFQLFRILLNNREIFFVYTFSNFYHYEHNVLLQKVFIINDNAFTNLLKKDTYCDSM